MSHHTIIADRNQLADERMLLYASIRTDLDSALNLHEGSDERAIADATAVKVDGRDDDHVVAEFHTDDPARTNSGLSHCAFQDDNAAG